MKFDAAKLISKACGRILYPIRPYWTSSCYGFGKWIRRYGYYPPVLPLCIYTDHGPGEDAAAPYPHELGSNAPVQFYHSASTVERWRRISEKPCYVLYSPFVFARQKLGIKFKQSSNGTIFFVAHSTPSVSENKSIEQYHQELNALPEKFHPITICLHIHDMNKGLDQRYIDYGYRVVTAGDTLDQDFTERFYRLLVQHKYALSNLFGSYALYATEMGMPFGLYGTDPEYDNQGDSNIPKGEYNIYQGYPYYKKARELFGILPTETVTKEQLEFSRYYLGIGDGIKRTEMSAILYKSLFLWLGQELKRSFLKVLHLLKV